MTTFQGRTNSARLRLLPLKAALLAVVIGIYGLLGGGGNIPALAEDANALRAAATGAMKRLMIKSTRKDVSDLVFYDDEGKPHTLKEWKGRVLLVNFWASWCFPCRKEMPMIAALQEAFPREDFLVIAASEDRKGYTWAKEALEDLKASNLLLLMDEGASSLLKLGERGLPVTILVDRQGREAARLIGPAEWNSEEAKAVIKALIAEK